MADWLPYRQLVLFDCNDDRLTLFKDHEEYLSQLPSTSECCIFWNDRDSTVYGKLQRLLKKHPQVHLCPSYSRRVNTGSSSDLLSFLDKLIDKFSFVLLVHGKNQSYASTLEQDIQRYGVEKLELKTIDKPFSKHLPHIISRLTEKYRENRDSGYLKLLSFRDQMIQRRRRPPLSHTKWRYDCRDIWYSFEINIHFKRLTKLKQKTLPFYYSNRYLCKPAQSSAEQYIDEPHKDGNGPQSSKIPQRITTIELEIPSQESFLPLSQYSMSIQYATICSRYSVGKPAQFIGLSSIMPRDHSGYQRPTQNRQSMNKMQLTICFSWKINATASNIISLRLEQSRRARTQAQARELALKNNPTSESISCTKCTIRFRSLIAMRQHYSAMHEGSTFNIASSQTKPKKEKKKTNQDARPVKVETIPCLQCAKKFKSVADRDVHWKAKHLQSNVVPNTKSVNTCRPENSSLKAFTCWKCAKNFKSTRRRWMHFINVHATSIRSKMDDLSTDIDNHISSLKNKMNSIQIAVKSVTRWFKCWKCTEKFTSSVNLLSHFINTHATFILCTDSDPSDFLESQIRLAQERMKQEEQTIASTLVPSDRSLNAANTTPSIVTNKQSSNPKGDCLVRQDLHLTTVQQAIDPTKNFICWQCSKKFTSASSRLDHFIDQHMASFLSSVNSSSDSVDNQTRALQEKRDISADRTFLLGKPPNCWKCTKSLTTIKALFIHFVREHADSASSGSTDPSHVFRNLIAIVHEQMKSKAGDDVYISPYSSAHAESEVSTRLSALHPFHSESTRKHITHSTTISPEPSRCPEIPKLAATPTVCAGAKSLQSSTTTKNTNNYSKTFSCSQCLKKFESASLYHQHFQSEHVNYSFHVQPKQVTRENTKPEQPSSTTTISTNNVRNQTDASQEHKSSTSAINFSEERQTELERSTTSFSESSLGKLLTNPYMMKCPKAKQSSLIYLVSGDTRVQVSPTLRNTIRCPHKSCNIKAEKYEFESLWSHTTVHHQDAQFKLECCDPTVMYTVDEYNKHYLHTC